MKKKFNDRDDPAPFNWYNKDGTLFGRIDGQGTRRRLELSQHSMLALARENTHRLRAELADRLEAYMARQEG